MAVSEWVCAHIKLENSVFALRMAQGRCKNDLHIFRIIWWLKPFGVETLCNAPQIRYGEIVKYVIKTKNKLFNIYLLGTIKG